MALPTEILNQAVQQAEDLDAIYDESSAWYEDQRAPLSSNEVGADAAEHLAELTTAFDRPDILREAVEQYKSGAFNTVGETAGVVAVANVLAAQDSTLVAETEKEGE